jgi:hypothetical protein
MWVVFEIESTALTEELTKVIGPFKTEHDADAYCTIHNLSGVMKVEEPVRDRNPRADQG